MEDDCVERLKMTIAVVSKGFGFPVEAIRHWILIFPDICCPSTGTHHGEWGEPISGGAAKRIIPNTLKDKVASSDTPLGYI